MSSGKAQRNITIDIEVDIAVRSNPTFNVSKFCNEALRTALNVKDIEVAKEEHEISTQIAEQRIKLQLLEKKLEEKVADRKKEDSRWVKVPRREV